MVIVGGGAQMGGIVEFAKNRLKLPAHVGIPDNIDGVVDQLASPQYATAVGLCLLGFDAEEKSTGSRIFPSSGPAGRSGEWMKRY